MKSLYVLILFTMSVILPMSSASANGSTTLFVGDSLSSDTAFAQLMIDFFSRPKEFCETSTLSPATVFSYARPSSASRHWSATTGRDLDWLCRQSKIYVNGTQPKDLTGAQLCRLSPAGRSIFSSLIQKHSPKTVVLALGANSLGFDEAFVRQRIHQMLDQIPEGSLCYWITPPLVSQKYFSKVLWMEQVTASVLQERQDRPCQLFATLEQLENQTRCDRFNTSDGLHHTRCGSTLWAETVIQKICQSGF